MKTKYGITVYRNSNPHHTYLVAFADIFGIRRSADPQLCDILTINGWEFAPHFYEHGRKAYEKGKMIRAVQKQLKPLCKFVPAIANAPMFSGTAWL